MRLINKENCSIPHVDLPSLAVTGEAISSSSDRAAIPLAIAPCEVSGGGTVPATPKSKRNARIIALHQQGMSQWEIAQKLAIGCVTVALALAKHTGQNDTTPQNTSIVQMGVLQYEDNTTTTEYQIATITTTVPRAVSTQEEGLLPVTFTLFDSSSPLSKSFALTDGKIVKTAAAQMTTGKALRIGIDFNNFSTTLNGLTAKQATGYGLHDAEQFQKAVPIEIASKATPPKSISRTKQYFKYREEPGIVMIDHDPSQFGKSVTPSGLQEILVGISPIFEGAACLVRGSVSAGVRLAGQPPKESKGFHLYLPVLLAADIPRCGATLFKRLWLAGHGFIALAKNGAMLERTLIDAAVFSGERLDFTGRPVIESDELDYSPPTSEYRPGNYLDTKALADLTDTEENEYQRLLGEAKEAIHPKAEKKLGEWVDEKIKEMVEAGATETTAKQQVAQIAAGKTKDLPTDFVLHFATLGTTTVRQVLDNPKKYNGQALADPIEGIEYGRTTAKFYANTDTDKPCIHSQAHGAGIRYFLKAEKAPASELLEIEAAVISCGIPTKSAPNGWKLTSHMVFEEKEKESGADFLPVCGPLWVIGRTNGTHGEWGLVLAFHDHDGCKKSLAIPATRLHEDACILARELATIGLHIIPGKEKRLLAYLSSWEINNRILSARRLGWMENKNGELSFVWPNSVMARNGNKEVVFQPDRYSPTVKTVHASGDLSDWQRNIAAPVCKHPPMLFALCAGLTPAYLAFAEATDSFIVHFWGKTSRGKTTLGQIAASPWGCAADPNDAPSLTFVRRWNLTGNGLEGLAEAHSDLPLVLDELGSATVGDIRPLIYQVSGGQGKTALNSAREMREPRVWRTIVISTGELSLHARMSDPDGDGLKTRMVKGGLTHRALDVELTDIATGVPKQDRESVVSGIKVSCARYYGTAGPELIRLMVNRFGTVAEVRAYVRDRMVALVPILTHEALPVETARAVRRFALIAVVGEFAAQTGLIPATTKDVLDAVREVVVAWLGVSGETDDVRIVTSVRSFILRHESRFQSVASDDVVNNRVGFVDRTRGHWMLTTDGLVEAAPGNDLITIARAIKRAGYLYTDSVKDLTCKVSINGGSRPRLYVVKKDIIEDEKVGQPSKPVGQVGNLGKAHATHDSQPARPTDQVLGQVGQTPDQHTPQDTNTKLHLTSARVARVHQAPLGQAETRTTTGDARGSRPARPENGDSALFGKDEDIFFGPEDLGAQVEEEGYV